MKDFLGNEFLVGDTIVYPKSSGRSVALVKATVVKFNESGTVTVQPEIESWQGGRDRSGSTRYVDTRTGKAFNPYGPKAAEHRERDSGYQHRPTGQWLSYEKYGQMIDGLRQELSWQRIDERRREWTFTRCIWKDYVRVENTVKPVTLTRTDNIVLVKPGPPA